MIEGAVDKTIKTYSMTAHQAALSEEARVKVANYIKMLFEAGEKDLDRLTACGLVYLRELDGSSAPLKNGFTGL